MKVYLQNPRSGCLKYTYQDALQEGDALCNEIFLSKYPEACSFRIYMVIGVYLQNPRSDCLSFMHLQEGDVLRRRPSEM